MSCVSYLDIPRLESLYDRVVETADLPGCVVECGCGLGGGSGLIAGALGNVAPAKQLYCCDAFEIFPAPIVAVDKHADWTDVYTAQIGGSRTGTQLEVLERCRQTFPAVHATCKPGLFGESLRSWPHGPISLLHADGDWEYSTRDILVNLWPHVLPGGVVIFDDYHFWTGCQKAVDEFFAANPPAPSWTTVSCSVWGRRGEGR
jgi:asparagine synthase (glutamine-hydrolysing)